MDNDRTRGNGFKLKGKTQIRFQGKNFRERVLSTGTGSPEGLWMPRPIPGSRLDGVLGSLIQWLVTLSLAKSLNLSDL